MVRRRTATATDYDGRAATSSRLRDVPGRLRTCPRQRLAMSIAPETHLWNLPSEGLAPMGLWVPSGPFVTLAVELYVLGARWCLLDGGLAQYHQRTQDLRTQALKGRPEQATDDSNPKPPKIGRRYARPLQSLTTEADRVEPSLRQGSCRGRSRSGHSMMETGTSSSRWKPAATGAEAAPPTEATLATAAMLTSTLKSRAPRMMNRKWMTIQMTPASKNHCAPARFLQIRRGADHRHGDVDEGHGQRFGARDFLERCCRQQNSKRRDKEHRPGLFGEHWRQSGKQLGHLIGHQYGGESPAQERQNVLEVDLVAFLLDLLGRLFDMLDLLVRDPCIAIELTSPNACS